MYYAVKGELKNLFITSKNNTLSPQKQHINPSLLYYASSTL